MSIRVCGCGAFGFEEGEKNVKILYEGKPMSFESLQEISASDRLGAYVIETCQTRVPSTTLLPTLVDAIKNGKYDGKEIRLSRGLRLNGEEK